MGTPKCKPRYPFGPTCAGSKLGGWRELGASWSEGSELEQAGRPERAGSKLEQARRLERAGSEGSELGGRKPIRTGGRTEACANM